MVKDLRVVNIEWERALMYLDVEAKDAEPHGFCLTASASPFEKMYPLSAVKTDEDRYRLTVNVTQFNARAQVPNGTYLIVNGEDPEQTPARFPLDRVGSLDDASRAFVYNKNRSAYTVTFGISDNDDAPNFLIRTYAFGRSAKKPSGIQPKVKSKAKARWNKTKRTTLKRVYEAGMASKQEGTNTILFASEARPNMQGNLKAVHDRMIERGLDRAYEFSYSFRTSHSANRQNALELAWKMGRADYILIDDYFAILKDLGDRERQRIIQLWHAGSGFKSVGYARFGQYGSPNLRNAHRNYSYAISGSQHLRDVYSEVFGMERESVIATGLPRIDSFLREGRAESVIVDFDEKYPEAAGKRKILFAPTFRGRGSGDARYDYTNFDFRRLYDALGEDSVFLFRQHHFILDPAPIPEEFKDRLIDVAEFPDSNDLLLISDLLVTDYSSIIYEYALLRRPMVFFAYDLDVYSATRGMHKDYREAAPGPIAEDFDSLIRQITDRNLTAAATEEFLEENFDYVDTHNSDRVIDNLILGTPSREGEIEKSWQISQ